jgi:hypothetical protein
MPLVQVTAETGTTILRKFSHPSDLCALKLIFLCLWSRKAVCRSQEGCLSEAAWLIDAANFGFCKGVEEAMSLR